MDDGEARGFMFSYEKLFGAAPKSSGDIQRERTGEHLPWDCAKPGSL
jgi:DNA helicase-2/ATP-dependent DNA helicase PcrA